MSVLRSFYKNIFSLLRGNLSFQLLTILTHVILVSMHSSVIIGSYAVIFSVITIAGNISTGRLELALMLFDDDQESFNIYNGGKLISLAVSIFVSLLIMVNIQLDLVPLFESIWLVFLFPIAIFLTGNSLLQFQLLNRAQKFNVVSNSKLILGIFVGLFQVICSFFLKSELGILCGYVLGYGIIFVYNQKKINSYYEVELKLDFYLYKNVFVKCKDFLKINNVSSLFNLSANQGPIILIDMYFGSSISAYYVTMQKTLNAPAGLFSRAFSDVFYRKITLGENRYDIITFIKKNVKLFLIGILVIWLVFTLKGEWVYQLIFGEEYIESYKMGTITIYFFFMRYMVTSLNSILIAKGMLKADLKFNVIHLVSQFAPILIGVYLNFDFRYILLIMTISGVCSYGYLGLLIKKAVYDR